jgi:hypothetical protein
VECWEQLHSRHCKLQTTRMEVDSHTRDTARRQCMVACRLVTLLRRQLDSRQHRLSQSPHLDTRLHHHSKELVDSELLPQPTRLHHLNSLLPLPRSRRLRRATRPHPPLMVEQEVLVDRNTRPHRLLTRLRVHSQVLHRRDIVPPVQRSVQLARDIVLLVRHSVPRLLRTRRRHLRHSRLHHPSTRMSPLLFGDSS